MLVGTESMLLFAAGCTATVLLYSKPVSNGLLLFATGCTATVLLQAKPVFLEGLLLFAAGGTATVLLYTLYWLCFLPFNRVCTVRLR